ncbi:hypothetical protein DPMN_165833 [Dreissena polymorpha]|uniref:Uncharacterized protein n=1 Tax=Dreissena polymorpha TaxID=45954 RepID=A0A9D4F0G2_DREPO|nr:hypothetical protein DPMN_165833 [Dreissena polymorpha]
MFTAVNTNTAINMSYKGSFCLDGHPTGARRPYITTTTSAPRLSVSPVVRAPRLGSFFTILDIEAMTTGRCQALHAMATTCYLIPPNRHRSHKSARFNTNGTLHRFNT